MVPTRLSGVGLRLGTSATAVPIQRSAVGNELFSDLKSALAGFRAQGGFSQALATQLLEAL